MFDNNEYNVDDEEKVTHRRLSPAMATAVFVGIILFIGLGIFFTLNAYQANQEDKAVTADKVEDEMDPREMTYDDYVDNFKLEGIEPIDSFVYNVKIDEEGREEIDPMYDDPYIGYEENENINAGLFPVDDSNLFILYNADTNEVISTAKWDDDYHDSLEVSKIQGEKAELTAEAMADKGTKRENIEEIEKMNDRLLELFEKINSSLDMG